MNVNLTLSPDSYDTCAIRRPSGEIFGCISPYFSRSSSFLVWLLSTCLELKTNGKGIRGYMFQPPDALLFIRRSHAAVPGEL
jgi:hypothetical protein